MSVLLTDNDFRMLVVLIVSKRQLPFSDLRERGLAILVWFTQQFVKLLTTPIARIDGDSPRDRVKWPAAVSVHAARKGWYRLTLMWQILNSHRCLELGFLSLNKARCVNNTNALPMPLTHNSAVSLRHHVKGDTHCIAVKYQHYAVMLYRETTYSLHIVIYPFSKFS